MTSTPRAATWLAVFTAVLAAGSLLATVLHDVRAAWVGAPAFGFLHWNLFLAWVPYLLALVLVVLDRARAPGWVLGVTGVVWLLFLPNAPYILTDFIHLGAIRGVPLWFDAMLIGAFAGTGLLLGMASLLLVHDVVAARIGQFSGWLFALATLTLCSIGIYLGRFPRFNSWDVLTNPHGLLRVVLGRLLDPFGNPFLIAFGGLMTLALIGSYLVTWVIGSAVIRRPPGRVAQYGA